MIYKFLVMSDNKLVLNKFSICLLENKIVIKSMDISNDIIKIPVYNKYNGINYFPVVFPLEMHVIDKMVFSPYIILSTFNLNFDNEIDFFSQITKIIKSDFNLKIIDFELLLNDTNNVFPKIMNEYYPNLINENLKVNNDNINEFIKKLWNNIIIIKLYIIYILIKFPSISNKNIKEICQITTIPKKILSIGNHIKSYKYNITVNNEYAMTLSEYYNFNLNSSLKLADIKPNTCYYILINKNDSNDTTLTQNSTNTTEIVNNDMSVNKVIKIYAKKINKNIISINETKNIIFENYKWYYYHPNIKMNKSYIIYNTFLNSQITNEVIKNLLNIDNIHSKKIIEYFEQDNKLSNLISISVIYEDTKKFFDDMNILRTKSYSDGFFEYITKKYSSDNSEKIFEILTILFESYNYPLKANRHDMDSIFDYILYFSLYHYKLIFVPTKSQYSNSLSDLLHPNINSIVPVKLKNLYVNLLKAMSQMINNDFESITFNQKFYNDYLHRNIIKLFFTNSNYLSINLFTSLLKPYAFDKFKNIVFTNMLLIDISNKLSWNNLPKKLNYLNFFYKNNEIVHYQDKINKNIMPENFDNRIKKIIENPFEMYKFLRKEKDFIKWTKFISDKVIQLYYIPISLSSEDFELIGKLLYLLFNINEQNTKETSYINFINFCNLHCKLILESNRVNLKIREYFPNLKTSINLGFLAKHLTWDKESISFDETKQEKNPEVLSLEIKLKNATKKYYKYKAKYLETKDKDVNTTIKNMASDTSSILPSVNTNINTTNTTNTTNNK